MRKRVTLLLTAVLCTSGVTLGACGGAPSTPSGGEETEKAEKVEEVVDPSEKFVGEWKLAFATMEDVCLSGDLSNILGEGCDQSMRVDADGKGSLKTGDEDYALTWELVDDNSIKLVDEEGAWDEARTVTYDATNDGLVMEVDDGTFSGTLTFTADGTAKESPDTDVDKAVAITSIDDVVGDWKLYGSGMGDMLMIGGAEQLDKIIGDAFDPSLSIKADGSVTLGEKASGKLTITEDGAALEDGQSGIPLRALDGDLVLDLSDLMGMKLYVLYKK